MTNQIPVRFTNDLSEYVNFNNFYEEWLFWESYHSHIDNMNILKEPITAQLLINKIKLMLSGNSYKAQKRRAEYALVEEHISMSGLDAAHEFYWMYEKDADDLMVNQPTEVADYVANCLEDLKVKPPYIKPLDIDHVSNKVKDIKSKSSDIQSLDSEYFTLIDLFIYICCGYSVFVTFYSLFSWMFSLF